MSRALVAGLMAGTSLDGVDAVLLDPDPKPRVLAHAHQAFDAALRLELLALNASGADELARTARCANELARHYADAVREVLAAAAVTPNEVRAMLVESATRLFHDHVDAGLLESAKREG